MSPSRIGIEPFGTLPDGRLAQRFTLINAHGLIARLTNYGATLTELHLPDRHGRLGDVVLGYDSLAEYLTGRHYFGCTVGRVANRIRAASFTLDGHEYRLAANDPPNHLHGGTRGFDKALWHAEALPGANAVRLEHVSEDGDEGYPGRLEASVVMTLTDDDEFTIDYTARTTAATPVNLTNHSYFNLAGAGDVLSHQLTIFANEMTPLDAQLLPTGQLVHVSGTPYDFRVPTPIGSRIGATGMGYDTNFIIRGDEGLRPAAEVYDPGSGRVLQLQQTQAGVQFYSGNFLDGSEVGKGGQGYQKHSGFTLETHACPDAVNLPQFPSIILRPGETWRQKAVFRFSVR